MSDFRILSDRVLTSPQILPADIADAQAQGVTLVINNRPDGEEAGQPEGAEIEAAARAAGLDYLAIPVSGAGMSAPQVAAMAEARRRQMARFWPSAVAEHVQRCCGRWRRRKVGATRKRSPPQLPLPVTMSARCARRWICWQGKRGAEPPRYRADLICDSRAVDHGPPTARRSDNSRRAMRRIPHALRHAIRGW